MFRSNVSYHSSVDDVNDQYMIINMTENYWKVKKSQDLKEKIIRLASFFSGKANVYPCGDKVYIAPTSGWGKI